MSFAVFVLSTGRCGTQWLAENLEQAYGDRIGVEHEPIHDGYCARRMLGAGDPARLEPELAAPLLRHLDAVERRLETRPYIECGYPCWSSIPYLAQRFAGRLRVVHLTRHPVPTALSWLTHGAYQPPLLPHLREKVLLSPADPGTALGEYGSLWDSISPFEKCLYYWAEVNGFGLAQQDALALPWLRLSLEDLSGGEGLARLLAFLELPRRESIFAARTHALDRQRSITLERPQPALTGRHPQIARTARALGYDLTDVSVWYGAERYFGC